MPSSLHVSVFIKGNLLLSRQKKNPTEYLTMNEKWEAVTVEWGQKEKQIFLLSLFEKLVMECQKSQQAQQKNKILSHQFLPNNA